MDLSPTKYHSEPDDATELLNAMDKGMVGSEKPKVEHTIEPPEPRFDWYAQDNNPASPLEQEPKEK